MPEYLEQKLLPANPFETHRLEGVGKLVRDGRRARPRARAPTSSSASAASTVATRRRSQFCHEIGLDYVSCSPYRVPIARLAAAHAALGAGGPGTTA